MPTSSDYTSCEVPRWRTTRPSSTATSSERGLRCLISLPRLTRLLRVPCWPTAKLCWELSPFRIQGPSDPSTRPGGDRIVLRRLGRPGSPRRGPHHGLRPQLLAELHAVLRSLEHHSRLLFAAYLYPNA